ncbi:14673_t:CDS:2 [Funneliformis caledonium]|uniref:14673_t:CDS:1 n=1 Tax=Funneliformis caledonium TaxID=1117310 RepID=A0A9N9BQV1_9GLOM|nr:14673_t:CDS:2 [Funneliformis caledonium]
MSYPDKTELDRDILNQEKSLLSISWKIFSNVHIAEKWYKNLFPAWKALKSIKRGELEPYYDGIQSCKDTQNFGKEFECDLNVIKFQSTDTSRMAFAEGLFNGKGPLDTCKSQPVFISSLSVHLDYVKQHY